MKKKTEEKLKEFTGRPEFILGFELGEKHSECPGFALLKAEGERFMRRFYEALKEHDASCMKGENKNAIREGR